MNKILMVAFFLFQSNVFADEMDEVIIGNEVSTEVSPEKKPVSKKSYSKFMPGSLGVGLGVSDSSEDFNLSRSAGVHLMYFPFKYLGFGGFYQYDEFRNIQTTTFNAEQVHGGLEVLGKIFDGPYHLYFGPFFGKGRFNRLNQRITVDDKIRVIYGGLLGASYAFNDAVSIGPSLRFIHLNNAQKLDTLSMKMEFQYRFAMYK